MTIQILLIYGTSAFFIIVYVNFDYFMDEAWQEYEKAMNFESYLLIFMAFNVFWDQK